MEGPGRVSSLPRALLLICLPLLAFFLHDTVAQTRPRSIMHVEECPVDIYFVLDTSESVALRIKPYEAVVDKIKDFTNMFIDKLNTRYFPCDRNLTWNAGALHYSDEVKLVSSMVELPFKRAELKKNVSAIQYIGRGTHTDCAIKEAIEVLRLRRSNKYIVVVTDGHPLDGYNEPCGGLTHVVDNAKGLDIKFFAVAVTPKHVETRLALIASGPDYRKNYSATDNDIANNEVITDILETIYKQVKDHCCTFECDAPRGISGTAGDKGDPGSGGKRGPPGRAGSDGLPGSAGDIGPPGHPGEKGDRGLIGDKGGRGGQGHKGDKGLSGIDGKDGLKGDHGYHGIPGCVGDPGSDGEHGEPGPKGDAGLFGKKGQKGNNGDEGTPGPPGIMGTAGPKGDRGRNGLNGVKGERGDEGDFGGPGIPGLIGSKGDPGMIGPPGNRGSKGDKGVNGAIGPDGHEGFSGDVGKQGAKGRAGAKGHKGEPGIPGEEGSDGPKGVPGPIGEQGPVGMRGEDGTPAEGIKGQQGFPGTSGQRGPSGDRGPKGFPGLKGDRGEFGDAGEDQNINGKAGPKGPKGYPGPPGDIGPPGSPGKPAIDECEMLDIIRRMCCKYSPMIMRTFSMGFISMYHCDVCVCPMSECKCGPVELIFVLDSSESIGTESFTISKEFIIQVLNRVVDNDNIKESNIMVVQYSHEKTEEMINFKDSSIKSLMDFKRAIKNLNWIAGGTYTGHALDFTKKLLEKTQNPNRVAIVLTDGRNDDKRDVKSLKSLCNLPGIRVRGVGVGDAFKRGPRAEGITDIECNAKATSDSVLAVASYAELLDDSFLENVTNVICKDRKCPDFTCPAGFTVPTDLMMLLDSSASIGENNFKSVKLVVEKVAKRLLVPKDRSARSTTRVGVIQFSNTKQQEVVSDFDTNATLVAQRIHEKTFLGSTTDLPDALRFTANYINSKAEPVAKAKRQLLIFTDGHVQDSKQSALVAQIKELMKAKVNIHIVSMGENVNEKVLSILVTGEVNTKKMDVMQEKVIPIVDYDVLSNDITYQKIAHRISKNPTA
ncbi:collagen alpha-1(VI) chain-like [Lampetra fluviatilis]